MNHEVKTFKFKCDDCGKVTFVRDVTYFERPKGWDLIVEYSTDSYRTYESDICGICLKKRNKRKS